MCASVSLIAGFVQAVAALGPDTRHSAHRPSLKVPKFWLVKKMIRNGNNEKMKK